MMMIRRFYIFVIVLLSACSSSIPTVTDRSPTVTDQGSFSWKKEQQKRFNASPNRPLKAGEYFIKPGDTLYSIAWAAGVNYQDVARWNNIDTPDVIQAGQIITIVPPRTEVVADASRFISPPANTTANTPAQSAPQVAAVQPPVEKQVPVAKAAPVKPKPANTKKTASQSLGDSVANAKNPGRWQWPVEGKVLSSFSPKNGRTGVLISGKKGEPVKSTAAGEVVYVGDGLRGYGNLVIVKHSSEFLSAYAHNDQILVSEGARIKAGQTIASIGSSGTDRNQLHFEIRKDGKPVNPMKYLN